MLGHMSRTAPALLAVERCTCISAHHALLVCESDHARCLPLALLVEEHIHACRQHKEGEGSEGAGSGSGCERCAMSHRRGQPRCHAQPDTLKA